jgi:hypothetical protein
MSCSRHFCETTIAGRCAADLESSDSDARSISGASADSIALRSDSWSESRVMMRVCKRTGMERGRGETSANSSEGGRAIPRSDDSD